MRATQQRGPSFAAPAGRASGRHRIFLQRGEREALNKPECAPSSSGQEGGDPPVLESKITVQS